VEKYSEQLQNKAYSQNKTHLCKPCRSNKTGYIVRTQHYITSSYIKITQTCFPGYTWFFAVTHVVAM